MWVLRPSLSSVGDPRGHSEVSGFVSKVPKQVMDSAQEAVEEHRGDRKIVMASFKFLFPE